MKNKMTVFILHGGYTSTPNESNKKYYYEIAKRIPKNGKILFIYFAQDKSKWDSLLQNDKENFEKTGVEIDFNCEIASSDQKRLTQQIQSSDCIYIRGGEDYTLIESLEGLENFEELIKGKTVVGSSLGAYTISKYFYSNGKDCIEEGLGSLPIKIFCHYDDTKKKQLEELKAHNGDLPVYTLPDTEFVIIEKQ